MSSTHAAQVPEILFQLVARISALPGVEKIILFGSYAKHTQKPESDLDLAVFFNTEKVCLLEEYRALVKICASTEENIEVQAFRTDELCDPCGIIGEITEFGVELWSAARLEDREEHLPDGKRVYQQKGYKYVGESDQCRALESSCEKGKHGDHESDAHIRRYRLAGSRG